MFKDTYGHLLVQVCGLTQVVTLKSQPGEIYRGSFRSDDALLFAITSFLEATPKWGLCSSQGSQLCGSRSDTSPWGAGLTVNLLLGCCWI